MMRRHGMLLTSAFLVAAVCAGALWVIFRFGSFDDPAPFVAEPPLEVAFPTEPDLSVTMPELPAPVVAVDPPVLPEITPQAAPVPASVPPPASETRLPVAGTPGYTVLLHPDGASELEDPDGKRTPLTDAAPPDAVAGDIEAQVIARLARRLPRRAEGGELIVLDRGVVSVPRDVVITFIGPDYLVTHGGDGETVVYHVDGRIEHRDRRKAP